MEFAPPPVTDTSTINFSMPPPQIRHQNHNNLVISGGGGGGGGGGMHHHHHHHNNMMGMGAGKPGHPYFKPFANFARGPGGLPMTQDDFDGKRLRKSVMRKTVDYNASIVKALENRIWQRDFRDRHALQPESIYVPELLPPPSYLDNPSNAVTTKFVKTATNKMRCPIFTLAWTPEGRRLVTGASSGEFTLWNGLTFNFETILQAHDVPVRTMVWSHNDSWMVTGDHAGYVKYWQSNMNNVKMFQAHKEPIRGISFSPSDNKFVSCSDDGTLRVWDFYRCQEERVLRGHGADVKCVHWHPQKALIVSGSKDNQQPIKLWDPKSGQALATLHAHKSTVMDLKWNDNGNWLVTASRDHLLKLFDLRNLREEIQVFRGHKKEASSVSWHPVHEGLFSSGGSDGSILFWNVGTDKEVGAIDQAHDSIVWTLAWHPLGHILCSGSNDHTIKFWTRNRPGDQMRDKYNLNTLPASLAGLDECDIEEHHIVPGLGPEDKIDFTESLTADKGFIPGLDLDTKNLGDDKKDKEKKVPYSKPIPRNFQAQWNDTGRTEDLDEATSKEIKEVITQIVENTPGVVPLQKIAPSAIIVYGKVIPVHPGSDLETAILAGPDALNKYISSGEIEELIDVMPFEDNSPSRPNSPNSSSERSKSPVQPQQKKSRFDDRRDHNAQMIYNNDTDLRQQITQIPQLPQLPHTIMSFNGPILSPPQQQSPTQLPLQQLQQPSQQLQQSSPLQQPFIPPLLALKVPQPEEFVNPKRPEADTDFRPFKNFNDDNKQNRPNPWATPPLNPPNGIPPLFGPPNNFNGNQNSGNFGGFNDNNPFGGAAGVGGVPGPMNNFNPIGNIGGVGIFVGGSGGSVGVSGSGDGGGGNMPQNQPQNRSGSGSSRNVDNDRRSDDNFGNRGVRNRDSRDRGSGSSGGVSNRRDRNRSQNRNRNRRY